MVDLEGKTISETAKGSSYRLGGFSPDGSKLVLSKLLGGELLLHDLATGKTTEILKMDGHLKFPCYSPDGKWIAFQFNESIGRRNKGRWDVYVVSASGGKPICLTSKFNSHSVAPCWRPRGRDQDQSREHPGKGQR